MIRKKRNNTWNGRTNRTNSIPKYGVRKPIYFSGDFSSTSQVRIFFGFNISKIGLNFESLFHFEELACPMSG